MIPAGSQHLELLLQCTEVTVRALLRLSLFVLGVLMISVALSPMFPVEFLQYEPLRLLESDSAWRTALFVSFAYGTGRLLFLSAGQPKGKGRFCSLLLACAVGSFGSLILQVAPEWNILPTGALTGLSMFFMFWSGVSLLWMQTFSWKFHTVWIALKEDSAPQRRSTRRFTEEEERRLPSLSDADDHLFEKGYDLSKVTRLEPRPPLSTDWRVKRQ